jgi:acyl-CoA synthetase (AMP-forming)/AMP-acid ligase II
VVTEPERHYDRAVTERRLLSWLEPASSVNGIHFAGPDDTWAFWSYESLARRSRRAAWGLIERGVRQDDVVLLVQRSGPDFVAALFGALLAGAVPSAAAPPLAFQDPRAFGDHLTSLLRSAGPTLIVTDGDLVQRIDALSAAAAGARAIGFDDVVRGVDEEVRPPGRPPAGVALLQFTSGSSGPARGVPVTFPALEANVGAIRRWLAMTEDDATASWMPVHHDLGLVGCVLTPIVNGSDLWLLQTGDFVRRPLRYLRCFGQGGATLTAMAAFGLEHVVRRVRPRDLDGMDFSGWRAAIVGAERLDAAVLERFHELLAPRGLRRTTLLPAYGLAEATLAVTGLPLDEGWRAIEVEPASLAVGRRARPAADGATVRLVGSGRPLAGTTVTVVDDDGRPLPDGHVGVVVVSGPSVAAGYAGEAGADSLTSFSARGLWTGDAGTLVDGQLFVVGRLGDSAKVRAETIFAEELEALVVGAGVPSHRVAVALGSHRGVSTAVAVLEQPRDDWPDLVRGLLRRRCETGEVVVVPVPSGGIARTSSGKPKRRRIWQAFVDGRLELVGAQRTEPNWRPV